MTVRRAFSPARPGSRDRSHLVLMIMFAMLTAPTLKIRRRTREDRTIKPHAGHMSLHSTRHHGFRRRAPLPERPKTASPQSHQHHLTGPRGWHRRFNNSSTGYRLSHRPNPALQPAPGDQRLKMRRSGDSAQKMVQTRFGRPTKLTSCFLLWRPSCPNRNGVSF